MTTKAQQPPRHEPGTRPLDPELYTRLEQWRSWRRLNRVIKPKDRLLLHGAREIIITDAVSTPGLPKDYPIQTFTVFMREVPPGKRPSAHGHLNEALFYILEGKGYEIHDGKKYDWEAGDVVVVHAGCVHAHYNATTDRMARAIVINPKPLYLFMKLEEQQMLDVGEIDPTQQQ